MKNSLTTVAAIFSYFVLYAPQPLLPMFADSYQISISTAGTLMTATLVPLATAPLLYGYLLSAVSPSWLLRIALVGMGISCLAFAHSHTYSTAFAVRLLQGILLPAALTAITTYIAADCQQGSQANQSNSGDELQKRMSMFITGTILGGLLGRVFSGLFATYFSWESFYYGLAAILFIVAFSVPQTSVGIKIRYAQPHINSVFKAFKVPGVAKLYVSIFCLFFSFVALLNYLPFIVKSILGAANEVTLGLMYCGFIMGVVASLNAQRLIVRLGGSKRVMVIGYSIFLAATTLFWIEQIVVAFVVLFVFCGAMFLVHSVAAAEVNHRSVENKSIVNALYVSFYYSGGVLGSYLPGLLYQHHGHVALIGSLLAVSGTGFLLLLSLSGSTR